MKKRKKKNEMRNERKQAKRYMGHCIYSNKKQIIKFTLKTRCKLFNIRPHQFILGKSRSKTLLNQYTTECGEKTTTARVKCHVLVYIYHNTMVRYMIQL